MVTNGGGLAAGLSDYGQRAEGPAEIRAGNIGSAKIGSAGNRPSNQKQASLSFGDPRGPVIAESFAPPATLPIPYPKPP